MIRKILCTGILKVLRSFYLKAAHDRIDEILFSQETLIAVLLGVGFSIAGGRFFPDSAKLVDICLGFLGYAAIALGFCVGGVTIALTLPDRDFVMRLATLTIPEKKGDALSGLFFVFCWTAVVHWFSVVFILLILVTSGHNDAGVFKTISTLGRLVLGLAISICSYALMQFLITVLTLWQVGGTYIKKLQNDAREAERSTDAHRLPSS